MNICWFCDSGHHGIVKEFAFKETPDKPLFSAHPECVKEHQADAELVEVVHL